MQGGYRGFLGHWPFGLLPPILPHRLPHTSIMIYILLLTFSSLAKADFKPSNFDTSPWLPIEAAHKSLWQPLLEKLNQVNPKNGLVKDVESKVLENNKLQSLDREKKKKNAITEALTAGKEAKKNFTFSGEVLESPSSNLTFTEVHYNPALTLQQLRLEAKLLEETDQLLRNSIVQQVFPNDPKYPSDHDFLDEPIFMILSPSTPGARISRSSGEGEAQSLYGAPQTSSGATIDQSSGVTASQGSYGAPIAPRGDDGAPVGSSGGGEGDR